MDVPVSLDGKIEFYDLVKRRASTHELVRAATVLQTQRLNLVTLEESSMRTVVSNLSILDPNLIDCLPSRTKCAILEAITKSIPRDADSHKQPKLGLHLDPDGICKLKKFYDGCTFEERDSLQPDLSTLKLLITSDLVNFDFNIIEKDPSVLSKDSEETWKCLASKAPNLRSIRDRWRARQVPRPGHLIVKHLAEFPNLSELQLTTFKFTDKDLGVLRRSCTKLASISLIRSPDLTTLGILSLRKLHLLDRVCFSAYHHDLSGPTVNHRKAADHQQIFELLPKLRFIHLWNIDIGSEIFEPPDLLIRKNPPQPFMLEEVRDISGNIQRIHTHLSGLKKVGSSDQPLLVYSGLPHLRSLHEPSLPEDYPILALVGARLVDIVVEDLLGGDTDLHRILVLCPNLEKLHLNGYFRQENQIHPVDPSRLKLKDLKLTEISDVSGENQFLPFWYLLLAPNLHTVGLFHFLFSEPRALLDHAEPLLPHLTSLKTRFEFKWPQPEDNEVWCQTLDVHNKLLSTLIKNCPRLETVCCEAYVTRNNEHHQLLLADVLPKWRRIPKQMEDVPNV
ncbi:uncharacterized protein LOC132199421 [Neocloeon triangulifer]|uniref:uncharacterized protein LOC132199421 n=1 Tax=Neocloeon triangulifer TaxID=2078957 RepID=UPI00286ED7B9|nr:uncharacterized protein LOC132199421 [Neocloeon triangulifer]